MKGTGGHAVLLQTTCLLLVEPASPMEDDARATPEKLSIGINYAIRSQLYIYIYVIYTT